MLAEKNRTAAYLCSAADTVEMLSLTSAEVYLLQGSHRCAAEVHAVEIGG